MTWLCDNEQEYVPYQAELGRLLREGQRERFLPVDCDLEPNEVDERDD